MRFGRIELALTLLCFAGPTLAQSEPPSAPEVPRFRFAWPDSGTVEVEIQRINATRRVAVRWELSWQTSGDRMHFHMRSPYLLALHAGGRYLDLDSALARSVIALESALPGWSVDAAGHFVGVDEEGAEGAADSALTTYLRGGGRQDGFQEMTRNTLRDPAFLLQAERRVEELWRAWVGEWLDLLRLPMWSETDQPTALYLGEAHEGERLRQVVGLPIERGHALAHLRSSFAVPLDSLRERSVLRELRAEAASLRPLQSTQRVSMGEAYEEQLVVFHWPDLDGVR